MSEILGTVNLATLATAMIQTRGDDAADEAERRAATCKARGDQSGCEAWWRVAAAIRDAARLTPPAVTN